MLSRWARGALGTLTLSAALLGALGLGAPGAGTAGAATTGAQAPQHNRAALTLTSQTPWVTPSAPWLDLALGISSAAGPASDLRVSLTFYGRLGNTSQLQQAIGGGTPTSVLGRVSDVPVTAGPAGASAATCVTVLPDDRAVPPAGGPAGCVGNGNTLVLGCAPYTGGCGDVYPVGVALLRQGDTTPVARLTTFLTYEEPSAIGSTGKLRVGLVMPVTGRDAAGLTPALVDNRGVPTTLAISPLAVGQLQRAHPHELAQLAGLASDQVLKEPYVPVNLAALADAGLAGEIGAQVARGDNVLRGAGFKPTPGPWVDTLSSFSQGDAGALASGLQAAGATQLVLSDQDLASGGVSKITFAQPFDLALGRGSPFPAVASDSMLSTRFGAEPTDPVLGAEQLLAGLSWVHYEDAYLHDARGLVLVPPAGWHPSAAFLNTLFGGLSGNPALKAVTLDQLFTQVPAGGNHEPSVRRLQSGSASHGITRLAAQRIAVDRQQLASFSAAVSGHPTEMTTLSDDLLKAESRALGATARTAALSAFTRSFADTTGQITLATERTITFTARRAAIPVTVRSSAPYPVTVVVTLNSDKFTFPNGAREKLTLVHPTTSWRFTAQARTSGDRLPIDVTLHTPNGQLLIARTVLTVQSTAISFAGVALTVFAGAVLLLWWVRTWRRSRRRRPRRVPPESRVA